jgi:hypothetical protein
MSPPVALSLSSAAPVPAADPIATCSHVAPPTGAPGCPQCERLLVERTRYRTTLTEMASSVGWPTDPEAHLRELQQLAHQTLGMSWDRPYREPTPVHARLAYGKQPGAASLRREPITAALRQVARPARIFRRLLKYLG